MNISVEAAWIALLGVVVATISSVSVTAWGNRRQRENELVVSALTHLVGGSQERTAGIAALTVLSSRLPRRRWAKYTPAVGQLLYSQLVYLLLHAGNRGQAHEIANIIAMADWLLSEGTFGFDEARKREHLLGAMESYTKNWPPLIKNKDDPEKPTKPDDRSVFLLRNLILRTWSGPLKIPASDWFVSPDVIVNPQEPSPGS
ncbi:hypothetical protein J2S89_001970 [Arthrobacter bambusae]|nr:hypothetical protein [Arthrobacter bambusae]MDQ0097828.1 hypothetical protein [Arthrobacter bambusae]